jgi:hypothetical protein
MDERELAKLRESKASRIACYVCGGSALPIKGLVTDPEPKLRRLISCDYCFLHWHIDCLNPPLAHAPSGAKKWMCPNHAEQVMVSCASCAVPCPSGRTS